VNLVDKVRPFAMAFYHSKGFVSAWKQANRYAGESGRIATLPDIIEARLHTKPGQEPWEMYFTTMTAEYVGYSRGGNRILIVAHGIGPMATLDGVLAAYGWQFKDKERNRWGGRITQEEFAKLESGAYGFIEVVDLEAYFRRYRYPFMAHLRASQAANDLVVAARFGVYASHYVVHHAKQARRWHAEQAGIDPENRFSLQGHAEHLDRRRAMHIELARDHSDPFIVTMEDASNLSYQYRTIEAGYAFAHLLSISALVHSHHTEEEPTGRRNYESLWCDVSGHGWNDGTRLLAIPKGARPGRIHPGVGFVHGIVREHWQKLLQPVKRNNLVGFRALVQIGDQWFSQYPKNGPGMDAYEPEFCVTSIEPIGGVMDFVTPTLGYYGFFKYDIREVRRRAPLGANAYALAGEPKNIGGAEFQQCPIQFFRVTLDTTRRVRREADVENDFDTLMRLITDEDTSA